MSRRTIFFILLVMSMLGANILAVRPAGASMPRVVAPSTINPNVLALPDSLLPAGSTVYHSAVSDNPDADGKTTPPDGHQAVMTTLHFTQYGNEDSSRGNLGRLTGYRIDLTFPLSGVTVATEYLASIFPNNAQAQAALTDAAGPSSPIALLGKPLPQNCSVGDLCKGFYGANPYLAGQDAVVEVYVDGPILIETVTSAPSTGFDTREPTLATALDTLLLNSDTKVKSALSEPLATATASPTPTVTPVSAPHVSKKKHCKKGHKLVKGKCKKTKKH